MGLMRALQAGISGLRNHQLYMDVVGNNIANVNTVGYKVGRVTFSEMFAQTLRGTTQPVAASGGTNPIQVGLGMAVGTIDTLFTKGSIETTGQGTDLALQGDGFFVLNDGEARVYTRSGVFAFNANGALTMPSNGYRVQGFLANDEGKIDTSSGITDITVTSDTKVPAQATTSVDFNGNLNAAKEPLGTILQSGSMFALEQAGDDSDMKGMKATGNANSQLNSMSSNTTTITVSDGAGNSSSYTYVNSDASADNNAFNSLDDLVAEINQDFGATGFNTFSATLNASSQIELTDLSGAANDIAVTSTDPILERALRSLQGDVNAANTTSDVFAHMATSDDLLVDLVDKDGNTLGLADTDIITIDGNVGGTAVSTATFTVTGATSTYGDYANAISLAIGVSNLKRVEISDTDGSLVLNGDGGVVYEMSDINITATDATATVNRSAFDNIFDSSIGNYKELQEAEDAVQSATVTVYDSLGNDFDLTMVFTKDVQQPNRWTWEVDLPPGYNAGSGSSGYVEFSADGSLANFEFDDGSSSLQLAPASGASALTIDLGFGDLGGFKGLTQLAGSNANTVLLNQNGFGMGVLERVNIDKQGRVNGEFSNGINKVLGQLLIANFNNPSGLIRSEGSIFNFSGNSGDAKFSTAGDGFNTVIISGALEQSNVDLAEEFTKMIVAQRGFQANARIITVSDEMINELTNLKR